jgi:hypothetical protein
MSAGAFFTFPLPLLCPSEDHKATLQRIVNYCIVTVGANSAASLDEEVAEQIIERKAKPKGFRDCPLHRKIILGAERLGVKLAPISGTIQGATEARAIIETIEGKCGRSPLVFIGASLLWGCLENDFPTYRNFAVTCAVNSVIGQRKTPVLIRRDLIRARAAGYKTLRAYEQASHPMFQTRPLLTISELRTALDTLEKAGLFVRIIASPRRTYFSKADRQTAEDQVRAIVAMRPAHQVREWRAAERLAMKETRENGINGTKEDD